MYNEEEIEDSLEFCRDIEAFYKGVPDHSRYRNHPFRETSYCKNDSALTEAMEEKKILIPAVLFQMVFELLACLFIAIGIAYCITSYVGQYTRVDGISMQGALWDKDYLIMDKLTYRFQDPKRYDIIVFPYEENVYYIKRIIGLPGESVQIVGKNILINGEILEEEYGYEEIESGGDATSKIILNQNEYFVLGDNRNHSVDSRFSEVGTIERKDIIGKAWLRIFPLNRFGLLKHQ